MAVTYVNAGTLTAGAAGFGATPPLPASVVSGNLLIVSVINLGGGTISWPAGWTAIDQRTWGTPTGGMAYRVATGADSAPAITWPVNAFSASRVFQFSGASLNPISAARSFATGTAAGTHTSAAITTTADNSAVIYVDLSVGDTTLLTNPAGWTSDSNDTDSVRFSVAIGDKTVAVSGSSSGAISTPGGGGVYGWVQWQQEILLLVPITGTSDITLPAIEFANTAITDTLGTSDQTLASIIALSEAYSGNSSSVTLANILASGTADGGNLGSSTQTLAAILASGSAFSAFMHFAEATSTASLTDLAVAAWSLFVTSTGAFTTTAHAPSIFWEVVTSSTTVTGDIAVQRVVDATVTGTVTLNGVVVGQASYFVSAASVAQIISGIQFVQDFWDGWAYNLNTGAPSTYEDFKFNSFARIGANYYGCNDTGIHLLSGDTDNGVAIAMTATLGTSDLSVDKIPGDNIKTVPAVYVTAKSAEPLDLTCRTEGQEYTYTFRTGETSVTPTRVDPGKGLKGTLWQFEVKNKSGSDAEISVLEATVDNTMRRI